MHRREVEMIAQVIRERRDAYKGIGTMSDANRAGYFAVESVANDINRKLKAENPSFRSDLFMQSCGMLQPPSH